MADLYTGARRANSKYVPQFTGSNAETLKSVADTLQLRSKENQANIDDALVASLNEQYAPGDEAIGQGIFNELDTLRNNIATSDGGFENSTALVRNAVRDKVLTNRDRIEGLRNKKQYDLYEAQLRELGADAVDLSAEFKGTKNADGTYNRFVPNVQKRLDYDAQKEKFFNQMEASLRQGKYKQGEGNLTDYLVSSITGGIDDPTIRTYANEALNRYKESSEYKQEFEVRKRQDPNATKEQIDEDIKNSIISTGLERVHKISKIDMTRTKQLADNTDGGANINPFVVPSVPAATKDNTTLAPLVDSFDEQVPMTQAEQEAALKANPTQFAGQATLQGQDKRFMKDVKGIPENQPGSFTYQFNYVANNVSDRQGSIMPRNQEEFKAAHKKSVEKATKWNEDGEGLTRETRPIYEDYLNTAGLNASAVSEGQNSPMTLTGIIDKMGLDSKDRVEVVPTVLNRTSPNANFGPNIEAVIKVNGQPKKTVNVRLHSSWDVANNELDIITKNSRYKGQDVFTKNKPFVSSLGWQEGDSQYVPVYYTTTIPTPDGAEPFDTEVHIGKAKIAGRNADGSPIITEQTFVDEQGQEEVMPYQNFKQQMVNISRASLARTYGSGQMAKNDINKSFSE